MRSRTLILFILVLAVILLTGFSADQTDLSPRRIMNEYRSGKGFLSFSVPMFMARAFIPSENQDIKEALRNIRRVRLLMCDDAANRCGEIGDCMHDFSEYFSQSGYVEIMQVRDKNSYISINALPGDKCLRNLIMIVSSDNDFVVIHLSGSMTFEDFIEIINEELI